MESKATSRQGGIMLWSILLAALAVWGAIAAVWAVRVDGLRRLPAAPVSRQGRGA